MKEKGLTQKPTPRTRIPCQSNSGRGCSLYEKTF